MIYSDNKQINAPLLFHMVFHVAPSAPPTFVNVFHVTGTTITVQLERVDCSHRNGHLTGYLVRYGVCGNENTQTLNVPEESATIATISNLMVLTTYEIEVAAVNSVGTGVFSSIVVAMTRPRECFITCCTQMGCDHHTSLSLLLMYEVHGI